MQEWQIQSRERLGREIAARGGIERKGSLWLVPSQSGRGRYTVCPDPTEPHCSCPDHAETGQLCKHLFAVQFVMGREQNQDSIVSATQAVTTTAPQPRRRTYRQNWPAYNAAQANEKHKFQRLLYDLCQNLPSPPVERGRGRPPLPLADVVFCVLMKVYGGHAARGTQCDLQEAFERGFLTRVPHYNAIPNYLDNPALTPLLHAMITTTSLPFKDIEVDFAADSSGFTGTNYTPWYDHLYRGKREHKWAKVHLITGVKTNIVTAVVIKDRDSSDAVQLRELLSTTARNFTIEEVSADKAYNVGYNQEAIHNIGATAFIPFKSNHNGSRGGIWKKAYLFYQLHRDEFDAHYHKRSNVETTLWMIKAKFGTHIRSKTETAMMNEVLCKVFAHNICVVVKSMYDLGIVPEFFPTEKPVPAGMVGVRNSVRIAEPPSTSAKIPSMFKSSWLCRHSSITN